MTVGEEFRMLRERRRKAKGDSGLEQAGAREDRAGARAPVLRASSQKAPAFAEAETLPQKKETKGRVRKETTLGELERELSSRRVKLRLLGMVGDYSAWLTGYGRRSYGVGATIADAVGDALDEYDVVGIISR